MKKITVFFLCLYLFSISSLNAFAEDKPTISAASAIVMTADTGTVIYENNAYQKRAMASITKIMSALITIESGDLDTPFTVNSEAIKIEGSSMGLLEGDIVTKRVLCYGMLLPSGNDAANAAAVAVGGSVEEFVELMNERAKQIGMQNTHFVTPSGLDADGHYTTSYDMAILARTALKNSIFAKMCATSSIEVQYGNPPYRRWLSNSNKMLHLYDGAIGVKTGFTDNAGRTLVSAAKRDGVTLICVTLSAPNDWDDHTALLNYGFSKVKAQTIDYDFGSLNIDVVGSTEKSVGAVPYTKPSVSVIDGKIPELTGKIYIDQFLYAPVCAGDVVGKVEFYNGENKVTEVTLVASGDVACNTEVKQSTFDKIKKFFKKLF